MDCGQTKEEIILVFENSFVIFWQKEHGIWMVEDKKLKKIPLAVVYWTGGVEGLQWKLKTNN